MFATSNAKPNHMGEILRAVPGREQTSRGPVRRRLRDGREVIEEAAPPEPIGRLAPETLPVPLHSPLLLSFGLEENLGKFTF